MLSHPFKDSATINEEVVGVYLLRFKKDLQDRSEGKDLHDRV